jgi:succinate-acetate transporter protein
MSVLANPTPLGLLSFGLSTLLLSLHNVGLFPNGAAILAMGLFVGGMTQLLAGILEFLKGNAFGATAFCLYGAFWWSLAGVWTFPALGWAAPAGEGQFGVYQLIWGVFTFLMFLGTRKAHKLLRAVFGTLFVLFLLLAIHAFSDSRVVGVLAGCLGVVCGGLAVYLGAAIVLDDGSAQDKKILPYF